MGLSDFLFTHWEAGFCMVHLAKTCSLKQSSNLFLAQRRGFCVVLLVSKGHFCCCCKTKPSQAISPPLHRCPWLLWSKNRMAIPGVPGFIDPLPSICSNKEHLIYLQKDTSCPSLSPSQRRVCFLLLPFWWVRSGVFAVQVGLEDSGLTKAFARWVELGCGFLGFRVLASPLKPSNMGGGWQLKERQAQITGFDILVVVRSLSPESEKKTPRFIPMRGCSPPKVV